MHTLKEVATATIKVKKAAKKAAQQAAATEPAKDLASLSERLKKGAAIEAPVINVASMHPKGV